MPPKSTKHDPVTLDGVTGKPVIPPARKINLNSLEAVRREMARLYRDARNGEVQTGDASRLAFVLMNLGKLIELSDLEKRIAKLEKEAEQ